MPGSQRKQNVDRGMKQSQSQQQCANKGQGMKGCGKSRNRQGGRCTPIDRQKNSEKCSRFLDQDKDDRQVLDTTKSVSPFMIAR